MSPSTQQTKASAAPLGPVNPGDCITRFTAPANGDIAWIEFQDSQQTIGAPIENVTVIQAFYPENTAKKVGSTGAYTLSPGTWALQHHNDLTSSQITFSKLGTSIRQEFSAASYQSRDVAYVTVATPTQGMMVPLLKGGNAFQFIVPDPSKPPEGQDTAFGRMTYKGRTVDASLWGCEIFDMKDKVDMVADTVDETM
jgi:hypothetical protein